MMWLELAIAMSFGGAGLLCGWLMHAMGASGLQRSMLRKDGASSAGSASHEPDGEQVSEAAHRLQSYALTMAADVDAHQTRMQEVNNSLSDNEDASYEEVSLAVSELIDANEEMQTQLKQAQDRIHEQTIQIESAERRAQTDALTRVPNRRAFDEHMEARVALGAGKAGTLALLDVDHFKKFNDVYGHRAGDEVLRVVANILHSRLQSYGLVARFGGEEFAIILDEFAVGNAISLVERARLAVGERDIEFEGKRLRVSASIGVAEYEEGESTADWLQRADEGLYRSKDAGRDCGHWMDGGTPVRIDIGRGTASRKVATSDAGIATGESEGELRGGVRSKNQIRQAGPGAGLMSRRDLEESFSQICERTHSKVSIVAMAIACGDNLEQVAAQNLMKVARSIMRSVDRIGCGDDSSLVICMPSIDQERAIEQARQICRTAESIGLCWGETGPRPFCIGISEAREQDDFSSLVARAEQLADQGIDSFLEPVWVEQPDVVASS